MKYRVLRDLSKGPTTAVGSGPRKGQVVDESELPARLVARLVSAGIISPVSYPPLGALSGWVRRAEMCEELLGITTVEEFLATHSDEMAKALGYQTATVERWKKELSEAVKVPVPKRTKACAGCRKQAAAKPEPQPEEQDDADDIADDVDSDEQDSSLDAGKASEEA